MIVDNGKYYIYRYIRIDKNQPFYIGLGTKCNNDIKYGSYNRSIAKKKRNSIWDKIVSKSEYEIEVLLESNDYEFIKQKEIEFIALYGRIDKKTGHLANMTDGGDGTTGVIVSEKSREKRRQVHLGKPKTKESIIKREITKQLKGSHICSKEKKEKISKSKGSSIMKFTPEGKYLETYESIGIAAEHTECKIYEISQCLHSDQSMSGAGYIWIYRSKLEKGDVSKLIIAVDRYLQNDSRRSSRVSLETKLAIANRWDGISKIKPLVNKLSIELKLKPGIIEYYIRRKDQWLKRLEIYKQKMSELKTYLNSNKGNGGKISEDYKQLISEAKEKFGII